MPCRPRCEALTHRDLDFWGKNQGNMHKLSNSVLHEEREKKTVTVSSWPLTYMMGCFNQGGNCYTTQSPLAPIVY